MGGFWSTLPAGFSARWCQGVVVLPHSQCFPLRSKIHLEGHSKVTRVPTSSSQLLPRLRVCWCLGLGQSPWWWSQMTARLRAPLPQSTSLPLPVRLHGSFSLPFCHLSLFNYLSCSSCLIFGPWKPLLLTSTCMTRTHQLSRLALVSAHLLPPLPLLTHFSEEFLQWAVVFKDQDLRAECAHYCRVSASRPPRWTELVK